MSESTHNSKSPGVGKWTRRGLLTAGVVAGGALVVGVAIRPGHPGKLKALVAGEGESLVTAWLKIAPDNTVTVICPHSEMGQGAQTALAQMAADELGAAFEDVRVMEAPPAPEYANMPLGKGFLVGGNVPKIPSVLMPTVDGALFQVAKGMNLQITGGSMSIRTTGVYGMRVAGAAAREMLVQAASDAWGVAPATLTTRASHVVEVAGERRAPFAELAEAAGKLMPDAKPTLKQPGEFSIMGTSVGRLDIPSKVDGSAVFGIDVSVDGMKYATVMSSPVFGGSVADLDAGAAMAQPGVIDVVNLGTAVGVVAEGYWQAQQALKSVSVTWQDAHANGVDSDAIYAQFSRDLDLQEGSADLVAGDVDAALARAEQTVEAEYKVPYLAHACMEPLNATAEVANGRCTVWTGTQNPLGFRAAVADELGFDLERVTLHNHAMGGGFGRRAQEEYALQAVRLAQAVGSPVKLIWSREEDMRQDNYRPAVTSRFVAALDGNGRPIAWRNRFVDKHEPAEATHIPYAIANKDIRYVDSPTHVPFGPWRSVDHSQHSFFTESFIDELAHAASADPYAYRRDLLAHQPRMQKVLDTAARNAHWDRDLPLRWGRGIAIQESFGSLVAQVVEIEMTPEFEVRVDRVVCAVDPGFAVSPDGLTAQIESGIVYGLTAALYGEISIERGAAKQGNFHDYEMLRMRDMPRIDVHIINSGAPWGGAGEPGTPVIGPALANAVFDATGTRVRALPLKNWDLGFRIDETG